MKDTSSEQSGIVKGFRRLAMVVGICLTIPGAFIGLFFAGEIDSTFGSFLVISGFTVVPFCFGWGVVRVVGWIVDGFIGGPPKPDDSTFDEEPL